MSDLYLETDEKYFQVVCDDLDYFNINFPYLFKKNKENSIYIYRPGLSTSFLSALCNLYMISNDDNMKFFLQMYLYKLASTKSKTDKRSLDKYQEFIEACENYDFVEFFSDISEETLFSSFLVQEVDKIDKFFAKFRVCLDNFENKYIVEINNENILYYFSRVYKVKIVINGKPIFLGKDKHEKRVGEKDTFYFYCQQGKDYYNLASFNIKTNKINTVFNKSNNFRWKMDDKSKPRSTSR